MTLEPFKARLSESGRECDSRRKVKDMELFNELIQASLDLSKRHKEVRESSTRHKQ